MPAMSRNVKKASDHFNWCQHMVGRDYLETVASAFSPTTVFYDSRDPTTKVSKAHSFFLHHSTCFACIENGQHLHWSSNTFSFSCQKYQLHNLPIRLHLRNVLIEMVTKCWYWIQTETVKANSRPQYHAHAYAYLFPSLVLLAPSRHTFLPSISLPFIMPTSSEYVYFRASYSGVPPHHRGASATLIRCSSWCQPWPRQALIPSTFPNWILFNNSSFSCSYCLDPQYGSRSLSYMWERRLSSAGSKA